MIYPEKAGWSEVLPIFEWNHQLQLGILEIDEEHQNLLKHINEVYDLNNDNASHRSVLNALERLQQYTIKHFHDEERFMKKQDYKDFENHCELHRYMLKELSSRIESYRSSTGRLNDAFLHFLKVWLTSHIMHIDRKYADAYFSKKSAS